MGGGERPRRATLLGCTESVGFVDLVTQGAGPRVALFVYRFGSRAGLMLSDSMEASDWKACTISYNTAL